MKIVITGIRKGDDTNRLMKYLSEILDTRLDHSFGLTLENEDK